MLRKRLYLIVATVFTAMLGIAIQGQDKPAGSTATTAVAPTSGARAEFLDGLAYYEQRFTRLAEAIPAEKYAWRPGEGVRSIGEVYAHISAANYGIARALGT